jgi:uncharacterized protein YbjT (DUF2867 family)
MFVITGATGNTGKPIAMAFLAAGKKVRIISRTNEIDSSVSNFPRNWIMKSHPGV